MATLQTNPVLIKELRSRMRGARAFIILTISLLVTGGISYLVYLVVVAASQWTNQPLAPQVGQSLFITLVYLEMLAVCTITPAITAGALSGEYENLTYEMLIATPLPPTHILWGKLLSALSYIFLLIFSAIPLVSVAFIYGGVAPREMFKALVVLLVTAVLAGAIGVFYSAWLKRTGRATVLASLTMLGMMGLPIIVYIADAIIRQGAPPRWILVLNPFSALASAITSPTALQNANTGIISGLNALISGNVDVLIRPDRIPRPIYHYTLPFYGLLIILLITLTSRLILPTRRWRFTRREALTVALWALALIAISAVAFGLSAPRYEGSPGIFRAPTPMPFDEFEPEPVIVEEVIAPTPVTPTPPP